jgi:hypothetical protein
MHNLHSSGNAVKTETEYEVWIKEAYYMLGKVRRYRSKWLYSVDSKTWYSCNTRTDGIAAIEAYYHSEARRLTGISRLITQHGASI